MGEQTPITFGRYMNGWRYLAIFAILILICTIATLIVVIAVFQNDIEELKKDSIKCPPSVGGLVTSGDPKTPSPFHDPTTAEYERVYRFLKKNTKVNLGSTAGGQTTESSIFMMDLLLPPKQRVLSFLDGQGPQPAREARVMVYRGDKRPPVVEEYRVGPLSEPTYADLIVNSQRRNPVPFAVRPIGKVEIHALTTYILPKVDQKVGHILTESYGGQFTACGDTCLTLYSSPKGTELIGNMTRQIWLMIDYPVEYYTLHPVDFGLLVDLQDSDPTQWSVDKVWYSGSLYQSLDDLALKYSSSNSAINKTKMSYLPNTPDLMSSQRLRGTPKPDPPQRPPVQMEPDGKRYSINHRHVSYLHWKFDIRLSGFTGPQVYDVRFQGDRIAFELGVSEIAVFYSGYSPMQRVTNFVDSGALIGTHSKSLIPGVDCPERATFLNVSFFGEGSEVPTALERAQCVFEQDTGVPLRRHLSYSRDEGSFYGGMADSVLIVRSILTIVNYDYVIDYIFHQSGAIECRAISTGYILSTSYLPDEAPYGFRLNEHITGNLHHHMFHFKADLDIGGTSNRYETLDISQEAVQLRQAYQKTYKQIKFQRHLYNMENDATYKYDFSKPMYHIVHNEQKQTKYGVPRAYRLHIAGMAPQMLDPHENNEKSIPWARQQLAVTVQKDDEAVSSSPYAMFDSYNPVTDFSKYINGESIVDQDLVLWITLGTHHIPHTEDIPVTPTPGGHLSFFLLPYNYFPECPSVSSRDNIRVDYVTPGKAEDGLKVDRSGNKESDMCGTLTLEQLIKENPDQILQTNKDFNLL
ncbi:hypothetical protein ACOMHN_018782 [Nucella lapillus]